MRGELAFTKLRNDKAHSIESFRECNANPQNNGAYARSDAISSSSSATILFFGS